MNARFSRLMAEAVRRHLQSGAVARLPDGGDMLWRWFVDLSTGRTYHAAGPNPITWADIHAFAQLRRITLSDHHIEVLRAMDAAFVSHQHPTVGEATAVPSASPMTPALFDTLFGG